MQIFRSDAKKVWFSRILFPREVVPTSFTLSNASWLSHANRWRSRPELPAHLFLRHRAVRTKGADEQDVLVLDAGPGQFPTSARASQHTPVSCG